ncbi:MAG TPA: EAL domain-containing protein [Steroidobacteraceae bacterium]|jgi:diguanylate cyclase (GGDEF)-like protein
MDATRIRSFMSRHRRSIKDLSLILIIMSVATFYAWQVDIFANEGNVSVKEQTLETDEMLLLGGVLMLAMLIFAIRRYLEQKRETVRRVAAETYARELAFQDGLTGLPNRRQYDDAFKAALAAPPRGGAVHAVFLLDLNGFKQINDVHGHAIGDEVLIVVAQRLLGAVRGGDLLARFGGDEFAILARHLVGPEAATNVALRVIQALEVPIATGKLNHQIGAGIGIAVVPNDATVPEEALRKADVALYRAKAERRSALRFFEPQMDRQVRERHQLEADLRAAFDSGNISTVYQPCFDLKSGAVVCFEAAPLWIHGTHGVIPPERFIPIAEETGLIHDLAARLLRDACAAAVQWPPQITLAVDFYPGQLKDRDLKEQVVKILQEGGLDPRRLEIEINESVLVQDLEAAQQVLGGLRDAGVRIALDNFGTGYSSLYHLRNFKIDKIKIDKSFVESMSSTRESAAIVSALVGLGEGFGLTIAAEGINNPGQQADLVRSGCQQGQGHLYSDPLSAEATTAFFAPAPVRVVAQQEPDSLAASA